MISMEALAVLVYAALGLSLLIPVILIILLLLEWKGGRLW